MISERWLSDDTKVAILLQEEAEAYRQLGDIKGEEMSWLSTLLVRSVEGEYSNVLGLPIATFVEALSDLGYELI